MPKKMADFRAFGRKVPNKWSEEGDWLDALAIVFVLPSLVSIFGPFTKIGNIFVSWKWIKRSMWHREMPCEHVSYKWALINGTRLKALKDASADCDQQKVVFICPVSSPVFARRYSLASK